MASVKRFCSVWRKSSISATFWIHGRSSRIVVTFSLRVFFLSSVSRLASSWRLIWSSSICESVPQSATFHVWSCAAHSSKVICLVSRRELRMRMATSSSQFLGSQRCRNSIIKSSKESVRRRVRLTEIQSLTSGFSKHPNILVTFCPSSTPPLAFM